MQYKLEEIEYKGIFRYFEEISNIPRGSRNNQAISDYLVEFAQKRGFEYWQDEFLNVVIIKEATKGYEHVPTLIIQGHMDMVCEKAPGIDHDFLKEGLDLAIDGDFVYAKGTTLGGDDGIAIAYALAILDDDSIIHPRLELLITTDEEIGMDGAIGLDASKLHGKQMLNIDSEEEGILLISSAGGLTGTCKLPIEYENKTGSQYEIQISGLQGGHSGTEIHKNRFNASLLLGRVLFELCSGADYDLVDIYGGLKDNSIPRESTAVILVTPQNEQHIQSALLQVSKTLREELRSSEPGLKITMDKVGERKEVLVMLPESFRNIIFMLLNTPNGVQVHSSDIEGLVESSLNLGILKIIEKEVYFCYSVRSSKNTYKHYLSSKLQFLIEYMGGTYEIRGEYAPWEYKSDSKLREKLIQVYQKMYQTAPKIEAIHAGLECGILASKIKDLDIVSLGPNIYDIHTPEERLSISSAKRVYDYLLECFKELCEVHE